MKTGTQGSLKLVRRRIMEKEIQRLIALLGKLDPTTDEYARVVCNLDQLVRTANWCVTPDIGLTDEASKEEPVKEITEETIGDNVIIHTQAKEEPEEELSGEFSPEEVRGQLTKAATDGIKIAPIMALFVPEGQKPKWSNIPASKYPDLIAEINKEREALKNAG